MAVLATTLAVDLQRWKSRAVTATELVVLWSNGDGISYIGGGLAAESTGALVEMHQIEHSLSGELASLHHQMKIGHYDSAF